MIKNLIVIGWLLLALTSCDLSRCEIKDKKLTSETRTGANTMSCKIDGKVWVANGIYENSDKIPGNCKFYVDMNFGPNKTPILQILAKTDHICARKNGLIAMIIDTSRYNLVSSGVKRYILFEDTATKQRTGISYSELRQGASRIYYGFNPPNPQGWLELTRNDTLTGIISGRFDFYAENTNGNGVTKGTRLHITEGRFDINYKNLPDCRTSWP